MSDFENIRFLQSRARGVRIALGSTYHGKRCIDTWWLMLDGEYKGHEVRGWHVYDTVNALRFVERTLRSAGCTFPSGNIEDFTGFGSLDVNATLREYRRVRDGSTAVAVDRVDPAPAVDATQKPVRERLQLEPGRTSKQAYDQRQVVADDLPMSRGGWK